MVYRLISVFSLLVFFLHIKCEQKNFDSKPFKIKKNLSDINPSIENDTLISIKNGDKKIDVKIIFPSTEFKGSIIVLPGWNHPYSYWIDSTSLSETASHNGYLLILPNMKKSIYSAKIYPETRKDWQEEVTRAWVNNYIITFFQKEFNLLLPSQKNYVLGLSTGGRGALFLALENSSVFIAGASLSGDFNPSNFPNDILYNGFFGSYLNNKIRWEKDENPLVDINQLEVPFYIGHGLKDRVVSVKHSILFYESLDKIKQKSILHIDSLARHNFDYWSSEVDNVIDFFNSQ